MINSPGTTLFALGALLTACGGGSGAADTVLEGATSSTSGEDRDTNGGVMPEYEVQLLTHNIGPWENSRSDVLTLVAGDTFDIIALQEVTDATGALLEINAALPQFSYYDGGTKNPIMWRSDLFAWEPDESGVIEWAVPEEAIGGPRTANWVRLHHKNAGVNVLVVSTQLISLAGGVPDAEALNFAMAKSLSDEVGLLAVEGEWVVVMGDLNARRDSAAVQYLLAEASLDGAYSILDLDDVEGDEKRGLPAIDYILVRPTTSVVDCSVSHVATGSQHQAQAATLQIFGLGDSDGSCAQ